MCERDTTMTEYWIMYSFTEGAFWSNSDGWGAYETASRYTTEVYVSLKNTPRPAGSQWLRITE